jgi:hypothetical protein
MSNFQTAIRWFPEPVRHVLGSAVTAGLYIPIGGPLLHPARQFLIWNLTNQTLMFSFDGITDHFPLPGSSFFLDDVTSNAALSKGLMLAQGETLYVKRLSPLVPTGDVYFSVFYATDGQ